MLSPISVSTLSRLESGRRRPTLDLLIPLARAHRVALDQLMAAPATGDPRVHLEPHRRQRGSVLVPLTQYPGEVAEFNAGEPHWFGPAGTAAVEILHLFGPHGDQAVVRTGPSATP
jgi:transcriptional regulator with XRE-family HTH domain